MRCIQTRIALPQSAWVSLYYSDNYRYFLSKLLVILGSYDIKQSMIIKRRQDRTEALHLPDDSDPGALFELGLREYKSGNTETAILFISKALHIFFIKQKY